MVQVSQSKARQEGDVFVVTEGPYSGFAGRDASRGLATFSVDPVSDEYDDLSDLKPGEMIISETPLVIGPQAVTIPVCLACYKPATNKYL